MNPKYTDDQILDFVIHGPMPADVTVEMLAGFKNIMGCSALHLAAALGRLPINCTTQALIQATDDYGWSALHAAARFGTLPFDCTTYDLIQTISPDGLTALHAAATSFNIPANCTLVDLKSIKGFDNISALSKLENRLKNTSKEDLPNFLNRSKICDNKLIKFVADIAKTVDPVITASWMARQINDLLPTPTQKVNAKYTAYQLFNFAINGPMPADVTAELLASITDNLGRTGLHAAAIFGHLPKDCTITQLIETKDRAGYAALHNAVQTRHLPRNKSKSKYFPMRPELAGAIIQFIARADRHEHPVGKFDNQKRWSSKEPCGPLCKIIRRPSAAFPFSELLHCRSAAHVAGLHTANAEEVAAIVIACHSKAVKQRNFNEIINRFPPRQRPTAIAAILSKLWLPKLEKVINSPCFTLCEIATARSASKKTKAIIHAWITNMLITFDHHKYPNQDWETIARVHIKLADLGKRIGMTYQCPPDLLAHAL